MRFAWQHDAERQPDGTLTLFDNESVPKIGDRSRAIRLDLDEHRHTATLVKALTHPDRVLADAEGNHQVLPGGGSFVGWGLPGRSSEFAPEGSLLLDLQPPPKVDSSAPTASAGGDGRTARRRSPPGVVTAASWPSPAGTARPTSSAGNY